MEATPAEGVGGVAAWAALGAHPPPGSLAPAWPIPAQPSLAPIASAPRTAERHV